MKSNFEGADSFSDQLRDKKFVGEIKFIVSKAYSSLNEEQLDSVHKAIDDYQEMLASSDDLDNNDVLDKHDQYVRDIELALGNDGEIALKILSRVRAIEETRRSLL